MKKIPLEDTLVGAYRFLFTNIISIIGTVWLPFVLLVTITGGLLYVSVPHDWLQGHFPHFGTPREMVLTLLPIIRLEPVFLLLALIVGAMVMVGLMRHSLGLKQGTTFVYFSLGGPVWRLMAAYVLSALIMIVVIAVLVTAVVLFCVFGMPKMAHVPGVLVAVLLGVAAFCIYFYTAFRLFFFLPAVVVAEGKIGIGRSWELGGGNFWRIFLIVLLIVIPVGFIASIVMQITVLPPVMAVITKMPPGQAGEHVHAMLQAFWPVLPAIVAVTLVERLVLAGLFAGAVGTAYKAVTAPPDKA